MRACENKGPPPLPVSPPPLPFGRGGGLCAAAGGPRPLASRGPGAGSRPAASHFRTGGEEECARTGDTNPGCNYPVRGYSPSMHFFAGDVTGPIFHLPSHFGGPEQGARAHQAAAVPRPSRRARARWPARESRTYALCGVPGPVPRVAAEYVRAGRRARARPRRGGRGWARPA